MIGLLAQYRMLKREIYIASASNSKFGSGGQVDDRQFVNHNATNCPD